LTSPIAHGSCPSSTAPGSPAAPRRGQLKRPGAHESWGQAICRLPGHRGVTWRAWLASSLAAAQPSRSRHKRPQADPRPHKQCVFDAGAERGMADGSIGVSSTTKPVIGWLTGHRGSRAAGQFAVAAALLAQARGLQVAGSPGASGDGCAQGGCSPGALIHQFDSRGTTLTLFGFVARHC